MEKYKKEVADHLRNAGKRKCMLKKRERNEKNNINAEQAAVVDTLPSEGEAKIRTSFGKAKRRGQSAAGRRDYREARGEARRNSQSHGLMRKRNRRGSRGAARLVPIGKTLTKKRHRREKESADPVRSAELRSLASLSKTTIKIIWFRGASKTWRTLIK